MEEEAKKICPICKTREPDEGRTICEDCLGNTVRPTVVENKATGQCKICGNEKPISEMHVMRRNWCTACVSENMRTSKKRKKMGIAPTDDLPDDDMVLILDFTKIPQVLKAIQETAENEFRDPNKQVLYILREAHKGAVGRMRDVDRLAERGA